VEEAEMSGTRMYSGQRKLKLITVLQRKCQGKIQGCKWKWMWRLVSKWISLIYVGRIFIWLKCLRVGFMPPIWARCCMFGFIVRHGNRSDARLSSTVSTCLQGARLRHRNLFFMCNIVSRELQTSVTNTTNKKI